MREYFMYGSVRGAAREGGPYRDRHELRRERRRWTTVNWGERSIRVDS
jgi:hypothetical protein